MCKGRIRAGHAAQHSTPIGLPNHRPPAPHKSYGDILARAGVAEIDGHGKSAADPTAQSNYAMHAHGAAFAEVKVEPELGQNRVTRLVGAFAAGRVINPDLYAARIMAA